MSLSKGQHPRDLAANSSGSARLAKPRKIGYQGRISIEANSKDVQTDGQASLAFLKKMAEKYCA